MNLYMQTLYRWVLSVKKNYRPVTYHNWRHAFNVAQSMYTIFTVSSAVYLYNMHVHVCLELAAIVCMRETSLTCATLVYMFWLIN